VTIGLSQSEELKQGGTVPTFGVKDIAAARAHLESLGTVFDGDTYEIDGMVKLATFYDPDGNAWMLAESRDRDER
jgi:CreA protein